MEASSVPCCLCDHRAGAGERMGLSGPSHGRRHRGPGPATALSEHGQTGERAARPQGCRRRGRSQAQPARGRGVSGLRQERGGILRPHAFAGGNRIRAPQREPPRIPLHQQSAAAQSLPAGRRRSIEDRHRAHDRLHDRAIARRDTVRPSQDGRRPHRHRGALAARASRRRHPSAAACRGEILRPDLRERGRSERARHDGRDHTRRQPDRDRRGAARRSAGSEPAHLLGRCRRDPCDARGRLRKCRA